ncbi:MAG: L-histidine N(alpha)-methyltransferase [Rhodothermales bacterium]
MTQHTGALPAAMGDADLEVTRFRDDLLAGLTSDPKSIPSKYFYDALGSRLFEEITELEEYYPTRTELAIMERRVDAMVALLGPRCLLVEYGSGSSLKTRVLLDAMERPAGYVPIDISAEHLSDSARRLAGHFPELPIHPVAADYTAPFDLPEVEFDERRTVVYFPGSTIGNFKPSEARLFLDRMRRVAGPDGGLLIGVDLRKDVSLLEAAYNDERGVTAAFNLNLLRRTNRELGATFELDTFRHEAVYDAEEGRIEMHLVSLAEQCVRIADRTVHFDEGERIHTEYSYKYTLDGFADLAAAAGLAVRRVWTDEANLFSVQYLEEKCECR